jgi:putative membrane protein
VRLALGLFALAGLGLLGFLTVHSGLQAVLAVIAQVGWGILAVAAIHLVQVTLTGLAWRSATGREWPGPAYPFIVLRFLRESINSLLPLAQIGGEVVGTRLLSLAGIPLAMAAASTVVDLTCEVVSQAIYTLFGLVLFFLHGHEDQAMEWGMALFIVAVPALGGFFIAQRRGLLRLFERLVNWLAGMLPWGNGGMVGLHEAVHILYGNGRAVAACCVWHLASWLGGAVEVWVILHLAGAQVTLEESLILESLGQAVRSAAFVVPGGYGVQEGGYMLLGSFFQLPPEMGLALSLIKRARELVLGLPGVLYWQYLEGRRLLAAAPSPSAGDAPP